MGQGLGAGGLMRAQYVLHAWRCSYSWGTSGSSSAPHRATGCKAAGTTQPQEAGAVTLLSVRMTGFRVRR